MPASGSAWWRRRRHDRLRSSPAATGRSPARCRRSPARILRWSRSGATRSTSPPRATPPPFSPAAARRHRQRRRLYGGGQGRERARPGLRRQRARGGTGGAGRRRAERSGDPDLHRLRLRRLRRKALARGRSGRADRRLRRLERRRRGGGAGGDTEPRHSAHLLGLCALGREFRQDHAAPGGDASRIARGRRPTGRADLRAGHRRRGGRRGAQSFGAARRMRRCAACSTWRRRARRHWADFAREIFAQSAARGGPSAKVVSIPAATIRRRRRGRSIRGSRPKSCSTRMASACRTGATG